MPHRTITSQAGEIRSNDRGLSLLETAIAIAITGLISAVLSGLLLDSRLLYERVFDSKRVSTELTATRAFLSDIAANVYPLNSSRSSIETHYALEGTSESVEFSSRLHPDRVQSDLYRLRLTYQAGLSALQFSFRPDRNEFTGVPEQQAPDIVSEVVSASISYLELMSDTESTSWRNDWIGRTDLPLALRVNLELEQFGTQTWLLPLGISGHQDCIFDPVSRTCL